MSYCRFSSDNSLSDVYIYIGGDGYHTHISYATWRPLAGKYFVDTTLEQLRDRVNGLIADEYHVPMKVMDRINSELSAT